MAADQGAGARESAGAGAGASAELELPPLDRVARQFTVRAIATGMVIGGLLSLCNIYSGLLIGWGFNMSVTAALLGYGFWQAMHSTTGSAPIGLLENNINQTAASSAASVSSAGLVAPIPALTILTGYEFGWTMLAVWVFIVTLVGIVVAVGLRRQMLLVDRLPFPNGIATAETVKEMYARGAEAMARIKALLLGALAGAAVKVATIVWKIKMLPLPGSYTPGGALEAGGVSTVTLHNLTFGFRPSLLMVGVGAIIGIRAGLSLLLGAVVAWGVVGPWALEMGWAQPGDADQEWFGSMLKWLLWPGVAMMVTASLTSFAFSWRSVLRAITGKRRAAAAATDVDSDDDSDDVPRALFLFALAVVLIAATAAQVGFFSIEPWTAALGVLLTFLLAIVAARVSGETGITPVGAMGKVTQLTFGVLSPGNATANLMAANVTGGAASQCADLLHDMKTGALIGASPRLQAYGQVFGALAGALVGSAGYLLMFPNPREQLLTPEWPAPAVAAWKAVAELFMKGIDAMPEGAVAAIAIAGGVGVVLAILEKTAPRRWRAWVPSPASVGLAFVINAHYSIAMFLGAAAGWLLTRYVPSWAGRFLIVVASGLIAGESLAGVTDAIVTVLTAL